MAGYIEAFKFLVPSVIVPLGVFGANWAVRYKSGYAQTAASDFLLAVIIFDLVAITTAKDVEPFVQAPELREIIVQWHVAIFLIGALFWWLIAQFGEPKMAAYYAARRNKPNWPMAIFSLCWIAVFALMSLHIGFFFMKVGHA
jgi:hypothetical protein